MGPTRPPVLNARVAFGPKKIRFGRNKQIEHFLSRAGNRISFFMWAGVFTILKNDNSYLWKAWVKLLLNKIKRQIRSYLFPLF